MRKKVFCLALCALLLALSFPAEAQQPNKVPRIGYLSATDPARDSARSEAIRLALRALGYNEGQNIATEYRYAEGKPDRLPALAAELVRLKVLHRQIARLGSLQDFVHVSGDAPVVVRGVRPVGYEPTGIYRYFAAVCRG